MKHILYTIVSLLIGTSLFAQERSEAPQNHRESQQDQQENTQTRRRPSREEIQSQKIAFFTQELDLSPQEAQKFWPVYNTANKNLQNARREINNALKELQDALKTEDSVSEKEVNALVEKYFKACQSEIELQSKNYEEILKVLPVHKAAKTLSLEERFRVMLIRQLRR